MFGQGNQAAAHLLNHGVREGDLFLFFGWFNHVRQVDGRFKFDRNGKGSHVIFGWLQVGEIWCWFNRDKVLPRWARYHPHVRGNVDGFHDLSKPVDALFIAKRNLDIPGIRRRLPGGGVFKTFHSDLCLSTGTELRSLWHVPAWMYPFPNRVPLTYHETKKRWKKSGKWAFLETVGRGQEFVLDLDSPGYPERYPATKAIKWVAKLLSHAR
jgi:hypothetical protein